MSNLEPFMLTNAVIHSYTEGIEKYLPTKNTS